MRSGGWTLIIVAVLIALGLGVNKGLRIKERLVVPGDFISNKYGFAEKDPDAKTLYCRYITWSGIVERVYRFKYSDTYHGTQCPYLLENEDR